MTKFRGSNAGVGHAWANQTHDEGQSGNGNFWFAGLTAYSYSTAIASIIDFADLSNAYNAADGRRVYLVTSRAYSVTTSGKHMPAIGRGIGYTTADTRLAFSVPDVQPRGERDHRENLAHIQRLADGVGERARKVQVGSRDAENSRDWRTGQEGEPGFIASARESANRAAEYAFAFGLDAGAGLEYSRPLHAAIDAALAAFREREADWNTPERVAKREADRVKREAATRAREARKEAEARQSAAEAIAAWKAGERESLPYSVRLGTALVRADNVKRDTAGGIVAGELVTSQGVRVPLLDAIRVFKICAAVRSRGEAFRPKPRTLGIAGFYVDSIAGDGGFVAGCHRFAWADCAELAQSLGVLEGMANDAQGVGQ